METGKQSGQPGRIYFAASNGADGFVNYYEDCFGEGSGVDRVYAVKGGPGTGKSKFLHDVARYAIARGWVAVYYACSSDPSSLDGLRLTGPDGETVGLLDGTAPHVWELTLPGARENFVDLGRFWDSRALAGQRERIRALGAEKAASYGRAYRYLHAWGDADGVLDSLMEPLVDDTRLTALTLRILRSMGDRPRQRKKPGQNSPDGTVGRTGRNGQPQGEKTAPAVSDEPAQAEAIRPRLWPGGYLPTGLLVLPALRRAVSMSGCVRLDTFDREARRLLLVGDRTGMGYRLLKHLLDESVQRGLPVLVSYDPVRRDKVDGLFWPETRLCVLNDRLTGCRDADPGDADHPAESDSGYCETRQLSLRRYLDGAGLRNRRTDIREAITLRDGAMEGACHALSQAAQSHFALEEIYTAAMDFPAKEAFTRDFCRQVFGE